MRRFKGLGLGKGYRNLQYLDPKVHSDAAKGRSQPQKLSYLTTYCYKGTYGRKLLNPELLIEALKQQKLKNLIVTPRSIKFELMGKSVSYKAKYNRTVGNIANWGHSKTDNRLFIDEDVPDRYKPQLLVHEGVEQFVSEKFGLKYPEAHAIAEHFEQKYAKANNINWQDSQNAIFKTKL
jgi:hypothetical protein